MPIVVVDKDGKPLPASGLVFGDGYRVENLGNGIVRIEVSGATEVSRIVTRQVPVSAVRTVTRCVTTDRVTDVTVTEDVTRHPERWMTRFIGTIEHHKLMTHDGVFTVTKDLTATKERYERTVTREISTTNFSTHDKYEATRINGTTTKEKTVTRWDIVTVWK